MTLTIGAPDVTSSEIDIRADTTVRGKLGQFGQGMIKLAADDVLKRFAVCARQRLGVET